jgi:hypothetical protein
VTGLLRSAWRQLVAFFGPRRAIAAKMRALDAQIADARVEVKLMAKRVQAELVENIELNRLLRQAEHDLRAERDTVALLRQALRKYKIIA